MKCVQFKSASLRLLCFKPAAHFPTRQTDNDFKYRTSIFLDNCAIWWEISLRNRLWASTVSNASWYYEKTVLEIACGHQLCLTHILYSLRARSYLWSTSAISPCNDLVQPAPATTSTPPPPRWLWMLFRLYTRSNYIWRGTPILKILVGPHNNVFGFMFLFFINS